MSESATAGASEAAGAAPEGAIDITFKLYASLTEHLPAAHRVGNQMALRVPANATIAEIIEPFALPMKLVHLVLINGHYIAPADRATRTLVQGDVLAIWPPVAGG
jgi:molybdopterin converting factor small subunit